MGSDELGSVGRRVSKALFAAVVLVFFMLLLVIGNLTSTQAQGGPSRRNHRHVMLVGRKEHSVPVNPGLIEASKRKVPNGPDPIHNRHVVETRRPPGRA